MIKHRLNLFLSYLILVGAIAAEVFLIADLLHAHGYHAPAPTDLRSISGVARFYSRGLLDINGVEFRCHYARAHPDEGFCGLVASASALHRVDVRWHEEDGLRIIYDLAVFDGAGELTFRRSYEHLVAEHLNAAGSRLFQSAVHAGLGAFAVVVFLALSVWYSLPASRARYALDAAAGADRVWTPEALEAYVRDLVARLSSLDVVDGKRAVPEELAESLTSRALKQINRPGEACQLLQADLNHPIEVHFVGVQDFINDERDRFQALVRYRSAPDGTSAQTLMNFVRDGQRWRLDALQVDIGGLKWAELASMKVILEATN